MCATCCTYRNGVTPDALAIVIYLHVVLDPVGGQGGGVGSPVQRSSPTPSRKRTRIGSWVPEVAAGGTSAFIFICISFMLCHS